MQISCLDDQNLTNRKNLGVWFSIGGNVNLQLGMFAGNDAHTTA